MVLELSPVGPACSSGHAVTQLWCVSSVGRWRHRVNTGRRLLLQHGYVGARADDSRHVPVLVLAPDVQGWAFSDFGWPV